MTTANATKPPIPHDHKARFFAGIALIVVSFLVYPTFVVIVFLPFSPQMKVAMIAVASLLSWTAFTAGIFLAGRRGYNWLKRAWKRRIKDEL
ncbi:MAG TPA: hypothetical protein VGL11_20865 [Candidatus Binatia bacterium]|jgi:hypothetical protein